MTYWNFEYTKVASVQVGGSVDQGPATEVTHLRLNQPPVFSSEARVSGLYRWSHVTCGQDQTDLSFLVITI